MGLFTPSYRKEHEFEWYYTIKASKIFNGLSTFTDFERIEFLNCFVASIPNSKNYIFDRYYLAKVLYWLSNSSYTDMWGSITSSDWTNYDYLIDQDKNPFLDFLMRLKHKLYENKTLINVIFTCCMYRFLDLEGEHKWVVDDPEFWADENDIFKRFMDRLLEDADFELTPDIIKKVL